MADSPTCPSDSRRIGVAVVGLGFGGVHVAAFRRDARADVVALCGRNTSRAPREALRLGVPHACTDWRDLLTREDVDVLSLAVPPPVQAEIAAAGLAAGKHVFFEKPLATSRVDALRLAVLAREYQRATAINFEFPESRAFQRAKGLLDARALGNLRHVAVTWRVETYANKARLDEWKARDAAGGGALNLFGSHCLHYLEWLLGPLQSVRGSLQRAADDVRQGDTLTTLVLRTEVGLPIVVAISTDSFLGSGHRVDIFGDEGAMVLENASSDYINGFRLAIAKRGDARHQEVHLEAADSDEDGRVRATAAITHRLLNAVACGGSAPVPGISEGLRVQQLIEAVRLSSQHGRDVNVGGRAAELRGYRES